MIAIDRGLEPLELRLARRLHLARVLLAWLSSADERPEHPSLDAGYDVARDVLWARQNKKCAYCERREHLASAPLDHVHPRRGADHADEGESPPRERDKARYWWLTWSWFNLLFVCSSCNCQENKGNRFPMALGAALLPPPLRALTGEQDLAASFDLGPEDAGRLLVDPSRDDPQEHLEWRPWCGARPGVPNDPPAELDWRPTGRTRRGWSTIWALGLDRDTQDAVNEHITRAVSRRARDIRDAPQPDKRSRWDDALAELFEANASYHAASWCALDFWIDPTLRAQWGLADYVFPAVRPPAPSDLFDDGATVQLLGRVADVALRLRVRSFTADVASVTRQLVRDLQAGGVAAEDIAVLLDLTVGTVRRHIAGPRPPRRR